MTAPACSDLRARLGVDPAGTASAIRSWLLVEHASTWGDGARADVLAAALPPDRHALLHELWEQHQLRPLLVRRPGRTGRAAPADPSIFVGAAQDGRHWLERLPRDALPGLDLEALAAGVAGHGTPVEGPVFAVCTNGSVDRCCAVRGRPLVEALAAEHPERTWEVSHVGGCRFAANLLVLPDGVVHGGVSPDEGLRIASGSLASRLELSRLRGRLGSTAFAGAAEVALRRRLSLDRLTDVVVVEERGHRDRIRTEDGEQPAGADVLLQAGAERWRAVVRTVDLGLHSSACDGAAPLSSTSVHSLVRTSSVLL